MKKFISFLLVAMLVVTCMATAVSAAGSASAYVSSSQVVNPGQTVNLTVGVTGEFSNYEMTVSADAGLTITAISGVTSNVSNGKVAYSSASNVSSHSFTVTVKVADDAAPGSYKVYATPTLAYMAVPAEEDTTDGYVDGRVSVSMAGGSCTLTIEEPTCEHSWDNGTVTKEATCTEDGEMTYTCILCGETRTEVIPGGHKWESDWSTTDEKHWHECSVCGERCEHEGEHDFEWFEGIGATSKKDGYNKYRCTVCGYVKTVVIPANPDIDDVPGTGDITTLATSGAAAILVSMMSTVALVVKRKVNL